ncbi:MAG: molybdopterin-dependent oxidoreductase, partial [Eggerthellaceae bacterium]|nr:molybdopterin-dependent oxidoreductase [Eggerthellaceae bacterium]
TRSSWYWTVKAREAGARIIVIDPLYTATAAVADKWLPVVPGSDCLMMCAVSNYLIQNGLANLDAVKKTSVAPLLIEETYGTYVRLSTLGREPLATEAGTNDAPVVWDLDANDFVAHTLATNPALTGTYTVGGMKVRPVYEVTLETISSATIEKAAHETGLSEEDIIEFAKEIATNTPTNLQLGWGIEHTYASWHFAFCSAFLTSLIGGVGTPGTGYFQAGAAMGCLDQPPVLNHSCATVEGALPRKIFTLDYLPQVQETGKWAGEDIEIRVIYFHGLNPLDNTPGATAMREALKKVDFVVCAEQFMTSTAHYSDMVLPVCMSWETEDFRNGSFMTQKAIEPIGEARPDFDIMKDIANAMGYTDLYPLDREGYLRAVLDTPENIAAGRAYDDYHKNGLVLKDVVPASYPASEYNALGRTQFYVEFMMPRDNWGQEVKITDRMPNYSQNAESYVDNPLRAQYPLFGFSNHNVYHGQSCWAHNAWLDNFRTVNGKPYCILSEEAAAARGIKTGDKVRATSQHGTCVLQALVSPGIQKDCVWFPHGFFWDEFEEGTAQELTGLHPDPLTSNANFNDFILEVEKC